MNPVTRLGLWAIDESSLREGETWSDVFWSQLLVPIGIAELFVVLLAVAEPTPIQVLVTTGFLGYACLPAIGAYTLANGGSA